MKKGTLYLIPCGLGGENESEILPQQTITVAHSLDHFVVEKEKTTRHFLKRIGYPKPLNDLELFALNKHTNPQEIDSFLKPCLNGIDMGLVSEAGCPAVADPGAQLVQMAHDKGINVVPLVGPSSILMALMASGMNGQSFVFHGYLPKETHAKKRMIRTMENDARTLGQSQIFMETPFRNNQLFEDVCSTCNNGTRLTIAKGITTTNQTIKSHSISEWKKHPIDLHKVPTVFVLG